MRFLQPGGSEMRSRLPILLAILALAPAPLLAQDMTEEELLEVFERQREAFQAAEEGEEGEEGGLGATRGLELITVDDLTTQPDLAASQPGATDLPAADAARPDPAGAAGPEVQVDLTELAAPAGEGGVGAAGMATDGDVSVAGAGPELPEPPLADAVGATVAAAAEPASAQPAPVVFGRLAPELQVNVRVTFPFDSAVLTEDQRPKLERLCGVMKDSDIDLFRIVGHTDAAGSDEYNERLSLLRAEEVRRYLVGECGIAPDRLEAVGLGERFLFDPSDPRSGDNRRVEFQAIS